MSERRFVLADFTHMNRQAAFDFTKQATSMPFRGPLPMLRLSANSSPNSGRRAGWHRKRIVGLIL